MPRYAGVGCRLRQAFEDIPPSLLPRPMRPVRLTSEEARLNYMFVNDGGDSVELLHRVRRGVKPIGTVLATSGRPPGASGSSKSSGGGSGMLRDHCANPPARTDVLLFLLRNFIIRRGWARRRRAEREGAAASASPVRGRARPPRRG